MPARWRVKPVAGGAATPPVTDISLSASTIADDAAANTVVGALTNNLGVSVSWSITDNTKFELSAATGTTVDLERSSTGTLTAGVSETVTIRATRSGTAPYDEPFSIGVTGSALLATIVLTNTSGSTISAGTVIPMFGHPFKKGDITTGTYPIFQDASDNSDCPYTYWSKRTWGDGSWKRAGFMLRLPNSIAGSGTKTINIYSGGSAPAASALSESDLTARDLKIVLTGIDNLSGDWESAVNQGFTDGDDVLLGNGGAGMIWRVRQGFMQAAADHGQLICDHYVAVLQNGSSGVGGFRHLGRVYQPYYDVDSPAKIKRDFSWVIKDGSTTIATPVPASPKTFTAAGGGSANMTMTTHGLQSSIAGRLSTTGTLPSGLSSTTTYYIYPVDASTVRFCPTASEAITGANAVTASSAGTGTHTFTPHTEIVWAASVYGADSAGKWQFTQGGGTFSADAPITIAFDKTYCRSTKMVPPYDLDITPTAPASMTYFPNTRGALRDSFGGTGQDDTIGIQPTWVAQHFLGQTEAAMSRVRVSALAMGNCAISVKSSSTGTIPVITATSGTPYTGMGTASSSIRWAQGNIAGFTGPTGDVSGIYTGATAGDHWPGPVYYAALFTGEPQYDDLMVEVANYLTLCRYTGAESSPGPRNDTTVTGQPYYGLCIGEHSGSAARDDAWSLRELGCAAAIIPDSPWEKAALYDYITEMFTQNMDFIAALNADQDSFWNDNGIYFFQTAYPNASPWQNSYLYATYALINGANDGAALTQLQHLMKFPAAVHTDIGIFHLTGYRCLMWKAASTLVSSMSQIAYSPGGGWFTTYNTTSDLFTSNIQSKPQTYTADDRFAFTLAAPTGASLYTLYYMINVTDPGSTSNKTYNLSSTPSPGSILDVSGSGGGEEGIRMSVIPSGAYGLDYSGGQSYTMLLDGALRMAEANGVTTASTARGVVDGYVTNIPGIDASLEANPMWAMDTSY